MDYIEQKPLFRWIVGNVSNLGMQIFLEALRKTPQALGVDSFDWLVCYNNLTDDQFRQLSLAISGTSVKLLRQNYSETVIPFPEDGRHSFWKLCPPRCRINSHEIVVDNDLVIFKKIKEIGDFLNSDKILWLDEPIKYLGAYRGFFEDAETFNSGLIGFPPFYDFGAELGKFWIKWGNDRCFKYGDEQGLIGAILRKQKKIVILRDIVVELHSKTMNKKVFGTFGKDYHDKTSPEGKSNWAFYEEVELGKNTVRWLDKKLSNVCAYHFVEANRLESHVGWSKYLKSKATHL